jgi:hypothetical protein
MDTSS